MKKPLIIIFIIPILLSFYMIPSAELVAGKITIEDLPERWVLILEDDQEEGFYIERWCDIGATNFKLEFYKEDTSLIHFHYGGDDDTRRLFDFEAWEIEEDNGKLIKGSFKYEPIDTWKSIKAVNFWWDENKRIAQFEGLIFRSAYFAPWKDKENYKTIEDCNGGSWERWE